MSKKINSLKEEGKKLKYKRKFDDSVEKFKQGIDQIRMKIKDREEKDALVKEFEDEIDLVYCAVIEEKGEEVEQLILKDQFDEALFMLKSTMSIPNKIKDTETRSNQSTTIGKLLKETEMKSLTFQGKILKTEGKPDESLKSLEQALSIAKQIYGTEPKGAQIISIENLIDDSFSLKIDQINNKGTEQKQNGQLEEALKTYQEALKITEKININQNTEREISKIQTLINEVYTEQIKPLIEAGVQQINEQSFENAVKELKKAESIADKMHDSDLKTGQFKAISEHVNPVYLEQIKPIIENGIELTQKENFVETISLVNEAAETFQNALRFAKKMIKSEEKENELLRITELLNQTCSSGIKVRKDRGLQNIEGKKFEEAIGELYSALSIAKNMAGAEDENEEIDDIKKNINKVYCAQIGDVVDQGKALISEKKYDEAIGIFNDARGITNKMYVSSETDNEIKRINRFIKDAEVKKTVAEGGAIVGESRFADEMKELINELDKASELTDPEYKEKKIKEIKDSIDQVRSKEIKFILEQAIMLFEQSKYSEGDIEIEKALETASQLEVWKIKNEDYSSILKANLEVGGILITQDQHEKAFDKYEKALEITEKIEERSLKEDQLFSVKELFKDELNKKAKQDFDAGLFDNTIGYEKRAIELDENFLEPYYFMGKAFIAKKDYDEVIEISNNAVEIDTNYVYGWNNMGLGYEAKGEYDKALNALNKAVEIDANFAEGWYNIGNVYKQKNDAENAIENYSKATSINQKLAKAWLFKGSIYLDRKDYDMALELIDKANRLEPGIESELKANVNDVRKLLDSIQEKISEMFKNK
jgi:tetratricopeptide (TPR) repeat protein